MNKFTNLRKVRQFYQDELGAAVYQSRLDEINDELKRKDVKTEETEASKCIAFSHVEVQTDPLAISLRDLSSEEILKLMKLLYEYQKIQIPIQMWQTAQR
jgi:hypothetical protein